MTSALYYQSMIVPQQQQQQQIQMYYHPQQQPQQTSLPHMMSQPQQVHHLIPQSMVTSTATRGHHHHHHHHHSHPPKEMNKPKGRMSAYTFFVQKCRDEHRKAYPNENANFSEFSKKCAEKWKTMTDEEKSKFAAQAAEDKQRFEREMAVYQPGEKRKKKKKDPLAPKRPLSAFFHYCKEERPKLKALNPSLSVGEIAKALGDRWNNTAPNGKHSYEEAAQRDKERYEKEMSEFRLANKKAAKSNSSSQALTQQTHQSDQQVRIHHDAQQQQQQQQQQQYSPASYQLPPFNPMQSFQPQAFAQMNNFQDNGLATSLFPHYNGYSIPMPHNNVQMQQFQALQQQQLQQHLQHQTYQTLATVNANSMNNNNTSATNDNNNNNNNNGEQRHDEDNGADDDDDDDDDDVDDNQSDIEE